VSWLEDFRHPTLGLFKAQDEDGWLGRSGPGADFYDLYVMRAGTSETPPEASLVALARAVSEMAALKPRVVAQICAAREARLNWRAGPAAEAWSLIEARTDASGALWLMLAEDETDEYSRWLVRVDDGQVRKLPALALRGSPDVAGLLV
jgi:hypothetical protein